MCRVYIGAYIDYLVETPYCDKLALVWLCMFRFIESSTIEQRTCTIEGLPKKTNNQFKISTKL